VNVPPTRALSAAGHTYSDALAALTVVVVLRAVVVVVVVVVVVAVL
jgi:hypothetical protein